MGRDRRQNNNVAVRHETAKISPCICLLWSKSSFVRIKKAWKNYNDATTKLAKRYFMDANLEIRM